MGQKDIAEKLLEDYPDVFADIINVLVFQGERRVREEDLHQTKVRSQYKADGTKLHEQERDNFKVWCNGNHKVLLGIENQTKIDRDMPLRVIGYDGAAYREQILDKGERERSQIMTLVLYFGEKPWKQPKSLKERIPQIEMMHVDAMLKFMSVFAEDERFLKLKSMQKEGQIMSSKLLDRIEEKGREEGRKIGKEQTFQLVEILLKENRMEEIKRIQIDTAYYNELLEEYQII
mgnify:CR=1 FL=1